MRYVFIGGIVRTMDPVQPRAEAVVVQDGTITYVGSREGANLCSEPDEEVIDFRGRAMLPGFIDAHIHFTQCVWERSLLDLSGVLTQADLRERLTEGWKMKGSGGWFIGRKLSGDLLDEIWSSTGVFGGIPSKEPVIISTEDMHCAILNKRGMDLLESDGVLEGLPNSFLERIEDGALLKEEATFTTWRWLEEREKWLDEQAFAAGVRDLHSHGITGIYTFERLQDARAISGCRACAHGLKVTSGFYRDDLGEILSSGGGALGEGLTPGGLKLFIDGTLGSKTALLLEPYEGEESYGSAVLSPDRLGATAREAVEGGFGLCLHAIGDRAVRVAIDLLEETSVEGGETAMRNRIEHVQLLPPDELERFEEIGAIASIQPSHILTDWRKAERLWGERCRCAYPLKRLIDAGVRVVFGSDAPAGPLDPLTAIRVAATRRLLGEEPEGKTWQEDEKVSVQEAVLCHTVEGAFTSGCEGESGRIREGFRADLVILTRDPFRSEEDLLRTEVVTTVANGEIVHNNRGLGGGEVSARCRKGIPHSAYHPEKGFEQ